jgi:hypothetical protein
MVDRFTQEIIAQEVDQDMMLAAIQKVSNIDALCDLFD